MKPTIKALFAAWGANIGRATVDGEAAEFNYRFASADLLALREALDGYFARAPQFPTIPGLWSEYRSLAATRTVAKGDRDEEARCQEWLKTTSPGSMGFQFQGNEAEHPPASRAKLLMVEHHTRLVDMAPFPRFWGARPDDLAAIRERREALERAGWAFVGRPTTRGRDELFFEPDGGWSAARIDGNQRRGGAL